MTIDKDSLLFNNATGWHTGADTITYSYLGTSMPTYYPYVDSNSDGINDSWNVHPTLNSTYVSPFSSFTMTLGEIVLTGRAIQAWNDVANVNLQQITSGFGDITFGSTDFSGFSDFGFISDTPGTLGTLDDSGDVWLNTSNAFQSAAQYGSIGWATFIHEIGRAIGLTYPDNDPNNIAGAANNNNQYTVMSYEPHPSVANQFTTFQDFPITPMILDIQAVQDLYGQNLSHNTGDTSYFGPGDEFEMDDNGLINGSSYTMIATIWDAGGVDTFDFSQQTGNLYIQLFNGSFSTIGSVSNNISIANSGAAGADAVIENAKGGSGNDTIWGNFGDNFISGGGGNDSVVPSAGDDQVFSGDGNDTVIGATGDDEIGGGDGADSLTGDDGDDTIYGGFGNDQITYGNDSNIVWAGPGNDNVAIGTTTFANTTGSTNLLGGGAGNDSIYGTRDTDDTVYGGQGDAATNNDYISLNQGGNDIGYGGNGDDTLIGGFGGSVELFGGVGDDVLTAFGSAQLWGGSGDDTLNGVNPSTFNTTNTVVVYGFIAGSGSDEINNFNTSNDLIDLSNYGIPQSQVMNDITDLGADIRLNLDGGDTITLIGVTINEFSTSNLLI